MQREEVVKSCFAVSGAGGIFAVATAVGGLLTDRGSLLDLSLTSLTVSCLVWLAGVALRGWWRF